MRRRVLVRVHAYAVLPGGCMWCACAQRARGENVRAPGQLRYCPWCVRVLFALYPPPVLHRAFPPTLPHNLGQSSVTLSPSRSRSSSPIKGSIEEDTLTLLREAESPGLGYGLGYGLGTGFRVHSGVCLCVQVREEAARAVFVCLFFAQVGGGVIPAHTHA